MLFFCQLSFFVSESKVLFDNAIVLEDFGVYIQDVYDRYGFSSMSLYAEQLLVGHDNVARCLEHVADHFADQFGSEVIA